MTEEQVKRRCEFWLTGPMCQTKTGVRTRLECMSFDNLRLLIMYLGCTIETIEDVMWSRVRKECVDV